MPLCVALLRGINVGGRNQVAMSDLVDLCGALGLAGARSLLQSGNLIFQSGRRTAPTLERLLEAETEKRLGVCVVYLVRTADQWQTIVKRNPFLEEAKRDPSHLLVMLLKAAAKANDVKALEAAIRGPEFLECQGEHLYIVYPAVIGRSKLTGTLIEKTLGVCGTARNWNTVLKLAALLDPTRA